VAKENQRRESDGLPNSSQREELILGKVSGTGSHQNLPNIKNIHLLSNMHQARIKASNGMLNFNKRQT